MAQQLQQWQHERRRLCRRKTGEGRTHRSQLADCGHDQVAGRMTPTNDEAVSVQRQHEPSKNLTAFARQSQSTSDARHAMQSLTATIGWTAARHGKQHALWTASVALPADTRRRRRRWMDDGDNTWYGQESVHRAVRRWCRHTAARDHHHQVHLISGRHIVQTLSGRPEKC